jgi:hypothetical protein
MLRDPGFLEDTRRRSIDVDSLAPELFAGLVVEAMGMLEDVMEQTRVVTR